MSYFENLTSEQKSNIRLILNELHASAIVNPFAQAAILAVVSKESSFIPQSERGYSSTSNSRIRQIFSKTKSLSDSELSALKSNDQKFFDYIYGGRYGNAANEGYKYRGRGFNQITFKGNYESIGKNIGLNLVANPDLLNQPKVAAMALVDFYKREFSNAKKQGFLKRYNVADINDFKNITDSLDAAFAANRGWGKTGADSTGGYATAKGRIEGFYQMITGNAPSGGGVIAGAFF